MLFRLCSYRRPRCVAKNRFESVEIVQNRAVKKPRKLLTVALRIRGLRGKPCTVPIRIRGPLDPIKPIRRYLNPLWWTRLEPWSQTSTNKEPNWKKWSVRSLAYLRPLRTKSSVDRVQRLWCSSGPKYSTHIRFRMRKLSRSHRSRDGSLSIQLIRSVINPFRTLFDFSLLNSIQNFKSSTKELMNKSNLKIL